MTSSDDMLYCYLLDIVSHLQPLSHRCQLSFKVIGTDTDRCATYDFPLMFHSNHGPILYHFRDIRWFLSKWQNFPTRFYFASPLKGFCLKLGTGAWGQKLEWWAGSQRSLTISSAVWIECTNVTDRQTDTGPQQRPRLRIASRGKN